MTKSTLRFRRLELTDTLVATGSQHTSNMLDPHSAAPPIVLTTTLVPSGWVTVVVVAPEGGGSVAVVRRGAMPAVRYTSSTTAMFATASACSPRIATAATAAAA
jgi:hypothetical protein